MSRKNEPALKPDSITRDDGTFVVSIDNVLLDPANLRQHDEAGIKGIEASIRRFKPGRSILIDGNGVVRAGNGTLEAARNAGVTKVRIVKPEEGELIAVQRDDLTASEWAGLAIADNRLTDKSKFVDELAEMIGALQSEGVSLESMGFTGDEFAALCDKLAGEITGGSGDGKEYDESIADSVEYCECPSCGHKWPK